jgi:ketosteroid isomerase-like protein
MSQENVELVCRALDAFNRRDLDAFLALMDDDVVAVARAAAMEGGQYHGHDGIRRWWKDQLDVFPDFTVEVCEVRDLGDVTVAVLHNRAHGAGSDTPAQETIWSVARWRRGKAVWSRNFSTQAEAFEAAGLSE